MSDETGPRIDGAAEPMALAGGQVPGPNVERAVDAVSGWQFSRLLPSDQIAAIYATASMAATLDADQPNAAAALRLAAVVAAETAGLSTVWGTEPHISPGPVIAYLQAHDDPAQFETVLQHLNTMRREARTGVMLAGYPDPQHAEVAQRERFVAVLGSLGVPTDVVDQVRSIPFTNRPELTSSLGRGEPT